MVEKPKEPKDLGVKIGSPDEVFWTAVEAKCKETILQCEREIIVQQHVMILTRKKIEEEKAKNQKP